MASMTYTETLIVTHCWCGIALAIPENLHRIANESRHDVYCPLGHTFHYTETYREKFEREQKRRKAAQELLAAEERSHAATRGHLARTRKRVAHGVCPCCHRSFANVRRHMASQHPEYVEDAGT